MGSLLNVTGNELRKWASKCDAQARATRSLPERERLLAMRDALLDLADNEDWLCGKTPPVHKAPASNGAAALQRANGATFSSEDR